MKSVLRFFIATQIIVAALFAIGLLRIGGLLLLPMQPAYVDQGDGIRIGSCIGLYPPAHLPSQADKSSNFEVKSAWFDINEPHPEACVGSSASIFLTLAKTLFAVRQTESFQTSGTLDARWVALTYACFFFAVALLIDHALKPNVRARIAHALCFALIVCDPVNTLYLGTLFSEPAALLGAYVLVAAFAVASTTLTRTAIVIFLIGALLLAFSRAAHFALPAIASAAFFFFSRPARPICAPFP